MYSVLNFPPNNQTDTSDYSQCRTRIWWILAEYQPFPPVYHTEDRQKPQTQGWPGQKHRETMSSNLFTCLKHSPFLVFLFPGGPGALPWPLHHSQFPPISDHLGNTFIIASLSAECPAHHAVSNAPSKEKATHPLTWTSMDWLSSGF